ncbi:dTDP-4-amino-4,6-dideoxygalactose transaminase [Streptoalloteichus tenebrarius]|uniref:Putative apramycin biosynthetic aminotransferase n=1 Tax=Streptoalloteichus tenebrarius (strain ATCC 17920 / DSM 40477 / JCM 4838 / CBS 697.72 / NBRC 16177 / NCIMB 11028 / NRRL B-12390 / A12253. 1 / ISP 5477) TaxID=1933 RepID=Q2MFI5_STRSD|nr:DegT/DnrJ/EryC1/StrS family aminotransferase [Streptoalloteichus tenebrarius]MCP2261356.1 dTDP-4-amino-4,6-dideoxygalactose transaminase [Streptoalloteichus tenebrarius]BFF00893.1 DegT/DnrJ/EryC1/StrS family aminotransferase [Streptoalloteichus tenebrarius]CAF33056.1 putative apramycin biosynthetic aminotransferase [Streptoalloteichus tenebrarius]
MSHHVPFAHVDRENAALVDEFLPVLKEQLAGGVFVGGEEVDRLERRIAHLHQVEHAVAVNSGTDALRLTVRALGIPRGSTGVTVANTFVATVGALLSEGLDPLLVDVGDDENVDVAALEEAITPDTRLVVAVHLRGLPAEIGAIRELCERRGIVLLEDCAQAVLATAGGVPVGGFGIAGCFSLHPLKNLGACGDAGVVVTNDAELAGELRLLRNHGLRDRDTVVRWGENSRLDALQAGLLNVKLDRLAEWTERRRDLAALYDDLLAGLPVVTPPRPDDRVHVYHRYAIMTDQRDALRSHLSRLGVGTAVHYPVPIHRQPAAADGRVRTAARGLAVTERQAARTLSLPLHPLMSEREIRAAADGVRSFFDHHAR